MRLIDKDALIEEAESGGWDVDIKELQMILKHVPTISAVPVVRGEWIPLWFDLEDRDFGEPPSDYKCSVCKVIRPAKTVEKYCPNCGARMDGES